MPSPPSPPPIHLRPALPEDAAQIATLGATVFTKTFGHAVSQKGLSEFLTENYSTTSIFKDITNPSKSTIVAYTEEPTTSTCTTSSKIVGFALLTRDSKEPCLAHLSDVVELQRLYVDGAFQGRGVGKMLEEKVEEMARGMGFGTLWLGVWEENSRALRVYEKMGFEIVGEHDFVIGEVVQKDLIMVKRI